MKRVIIDTDILIDIGRNVAKAVSFLDKIEKEFTTIISHYQRGIFGNKKSK